MSTRGSDEQDGRSVPPVTRGPTVKLWPKWFRVLFLVLLAALGAWGLITIVVDSVRTGTFAVPSYVLGRLAAGLVVPVVVGVGALALLGLQKLRQRRR